MLLCTSFAFARCVLPLAADGRIFLTAGAMASLVEVVCLVLAQNLPEVLGGGELSTAGVSTILDNWLIRNSL